MRALIARVRQDTNAQDLVEYALVVALVGLAGIAAWTLIRANLETRYERYDSDTQDLYAPPNPL